MATFNGNPAASADDAQESSGGIVSTTRTSSNTGHNSSVEWSGIRIPNVTIPKGSTVTNAVLSLKNTGAAVDSPKMDMFCQAADNAGQFTTGSNDISGRSRTSATVLWSATDVGGSIYTDSPDFSSVVQEVINRSGWASGNALVILLRGVTGGSYDFFYWDSGSGANQPLVTITYTPPAGGTPFRRTNRYFRRAA